MENEESLLSKFTALRATDPVVAAFYQTWRMGAFPSFETMLLALVIALAEQRQRLTAAAIRRNMEQK